MALKLGFGLFALAARALFAGGSGDPGRLAIA
jgi:hypothetical protein